MLTLNSAARRESFLTLFHGGEGFRSGREIRMWRDELLALRRAPFDTNNSIIVG